MYIKAIKYKDIWRLAPGSEAHQLHADKKFDALDKLLKQCSDAKRKLEGIK